MGNMQLQVGSLSFSYWPSLQMFAENRGAGTTTVSPQQSATPAVGPSASAEPGSSTGSVGSTPLDVSSLPPDKRYLRTQDLDKLPDLVVGRTGGMDPMSSEPSGLDVPEPPAGDAAGLPGDDDLTMTELSQTIGTLTVEPDPGMRERIGQLSTTGVSEFIGQFVQNLTTTPSSQIPRSYHRRQTCPATTTDSHTLPQ